MRQAFIALHARLVIAARMLTGTAASAVTSSAPGVLPGVASAGAVAANDGLSPFSSLMDTLFRSTTSDAGPATAQTPDAAATGMIMQSPSFQPVVQTVSAAAPADAAPIANGAPDATAATSALQTQFAASQAPVPVAVAPLADATQADLASMTPGDASASALAPQASSSDKAAPLSADAAAAPSNAMASSVISTLREPSKPTSAPVWTPERSIGANVNGPAGSTGDPSAQLQALSAATGPKPVIKSDTSDASSATPQPHSTKAAPGAADADPPPVVSISTTIAPPVLSAVSPVQAPVPAVQDNPTQSALSASAPGPTDLAPTPARAPQPAPPLTTTSGADPAAADGSAPSAPATSTAFTASAVQPTAGQPVASSPSSATPPPVGSTPLSSPLTATSAAAPNSAPVQTAEAPAQTGAAPAEVSAATPSFMPQPSAVAQFTGRARSASSPAPAVKGGSSVDRIPIFSSTGGTVSNASAPAADLRADVEQVGASGGQTEDPASGQDGSSTGQATADAGPQVATPMAQTPTLATAPSASIIDPAPARTPSDTVANLSAQIAQTASGQTTRFDVQLDPVGLGRVNVSVEIDAKGAMSAALSFEKSESASLLKSHSAELQQSLAQAGFDLSNSALSFTTVDAHGGGAGGQNAFLGADGGSGQQGGQGQSGQAQNAGRAFGAASLAADQADHTITSSRGLTARGVDIRI